MKKYLFSLMCVTSNAQCLEVPKDAVLALIEKRLYAVVGEMEDSLIEGIDGDPRVLRANIGYRSVVMLQLAEIEGSDAKIRAASEMLHDFELTLLSQKLKKATERITNLTLAVAALTTEAQELKIGAQNPSSAGQKKKKKKKK